MHIDAAWAGVALACPEYREHGRLDAINQYADSFATNMHKWGLVVSLFLSPYFLSHAH